jgi:hypothetical protein
MIIKVVSLLSGNLLKEGVLPDLLAARGVVGGYTYRLIKKIQDLLIPPATYRLIKILQTYPSPTKIPSKDSI